MKIYISRDRKQMKTYQFTNYQFSGHMNINEIKFIRKKSNKIKPNNLDCTVTITE